jgi:hypothetical protein
MVCLIDQAPNLGSWRAHACLGLLATCLLIGCGPSTECTTYRRASVIQMRTEFSSGCFELSDVVVVARTPSTQAPRLYVQDPNGGDFSAIMGKCDATSTHPCSGATAAALLRLLNGAAVSVRGYYHLGMISGFEELQIDDFTDQGTLHDLPPSASLLSSDLARQARTRAQWFQRAGVDVPKADPLVMYDLSPAEFQLSGPCPAWGGFGMIPLSAGTAPPADCTQNANPASVAKPDAREVLMGRQFFDVFSYSSDCACAAASKQHLLTSASFIDGALSGILILELDSASSATYQVFEPLSKALFPVR